MGHRMSALVAHKLGSGKSDSFHADNGPRGGQKVFEEMLSMYLQMSARQLDVFLECLQNQRQFK